MAEPAAPAELTEEQQFERELDDWLITCYADPLRYVLGAWAWGDPGPLENEPGPEPWQADFLRDLGNLVRARGFDGITPVLPILMAVSSGHGSGKTALLAWIVHWLMDTRGDCKTRVTANTVTQLEDATWAAVQSWGATKITAARWIINSGAMYIPGDRANWFARPVTCKEENSQAFAGLHNRKSSTVYVFDEASTISEKVFEVAMGGLTDGEPFVFLFGNMTRRQGQLHRAVFGAERDRWNHRVIDCEAITYNNPARRAINEQLYAEWKAIYGEDSDYVRVRVHGLPPNADELQFIDATRIAQAQANGTAPVFGEPLVCGVDVSGGGSAWTVARFRRGLDARSLPPIRMTGEQTIKNERQLIIGRLAAVLSERDPLKYVSAMFIDSAFGSPIVVRLRQMGFDNVFEVSFGGESLDPHCANKRAEMWNALKEWLPKGAIPPKDQRLADDLEAPGFHINRQNRLVLESKADMQKRGIASPDDADALALTFAHPVAPPKIQTQTVPPPSFAGPNGWMA